MCLKPQVISLLIASYLCHIFHTLNSVSNFLVVQASKRAFPQVGILILNASPIMNADKILSFQLTKCLL